MALTSERKSQAVSNKVINALLDAFHDILDTDGKKSLLYFAGLDRLQQNLPQGYSSWKILIKLLESMEVLLQYSDKILFELGRKFTIYFDPQGSSFIEFIHRLEEQFYELHIFILHQNSRSFEIELKTNGTKTPLLRNEWLIYFYRGLFYEGYRKSNGFDAFVEIIGCNEESLHLSIKGK